MPLINTQDAFYVGGVAVDHVYAGDVHVWPAAAVGPTLSYCPAEPVPNNGMVRVTLSGAVPGNSYTLPDTGRFGLWPPFPKPDTQVADASGICVWSASQSHNSGTNPDVYVEPFSIHDGPTAADPVLVVGEFAVRPSVLTSWPISTSAPGNVGVPIVVTVKNNTTPGSAGLIAGRQYQVAQFLGPPIMSIAVPVVTYDGTNPLTWSVTPTAAGSGIQMIVFIQPLPADAACFPMSFPGFNPDPYPAEVVGSTSAANIV